jgi:hypothetical protein
VLSRRYQQNFADLRSVSGLEKTDDIVAVFMKNEEETFSLFNFIQTLNQETDFTLEQHARLEEEIMSYADEQKDQESSRQRTVESYRKQVRAREREGRASGCCARHSHPLSLALAPTLSHLPLLYS